MRILRYLLLGCALFLTIGWSRAEAQADITMEATVAWIIEEKTIQVLDREQTYQKLKLLIMSGPEKGQEIIYENGLLPTSSVQTYQMGDKLIIGKSEAQTGEENYYIIDVVRRNSLYVLAALFVGLVVLVSRLRAVRALLALGFSFVVIFLLLLPQILNGHDPVMVSLLAALLILPVTFYMSHGWNKKTHVAILGTFIALVMTGILARLFVNGAQLTGFSSEEATFLRALKGSQINVQGLLLAGIIIGILGILDDVTVSQASVVKELAKANKSLKGLELFKTAMRVGTDHIASMINTLVLVYTGAAMPLLLLFMDTPKPVTEIINYEMVAVEIVRMLVGSIGLVLAVPLTTLLAVKAFTAREPARQRAGK
jgi:uncharacterized membrane protein